MLGTPLTSGGLFPLTRVFRMVGRSRDVSTLTLMLVFWVNAVLMALKLSSSAPLHTPSASMDVTLGGPLQKLAPVNVVGGNVLFDELIQIPTVTTIECWHNDSPCASRAQQQIET